MAKKESRRPKESSFRVSICDEAKGAAAEYSVTEFGDKILDTLFGLGQADAAKDGPVQAENILAALDENVHVEAIGDPSKALLKNFDVSGASFWSSIIQDAPIDGLDKPLSLLERCVTLAGALVSVSHGNLAMASACFKVFMRNEVHDLTVKAVERCISGDSKRNSGMFLRANKSDPPRRKTDIPSRNDKSYPGIPC